MEKISNTEATIKIRPSQHLTRNTRNSNRELFANRSHMCSCLILLVAFLEANRKPTRSGKRSQKEATLNSTKYCNHGLPYCLTNLNSARRSRGPEVENAVVV
jgi:hypothetical protein